jgi:hypothetical protein
MADTSDNASGWPGLLGQLNRTFDLIRDIFGYALPGFVFLAIGVIAKNSGTGQHGGFSLPELQHVVDKVPFDIPVWALFLGFIAACYASGSVLAATIYMPLSLLKYAVWMISRHFGDRDVINTTTSEVSIDHHRKLSPGSHMRVTAGQFRHLPDGVVLCARVFNTTTEDVILGKTKIPAGRSELVAMEQSAGLPSGVVLHDPAPPEGTWRSWLINNPTEVSPKTLEIRLGHRDLLNTLDRRETLNVMGGSLAAAFLIGYYIFYCQQWGFAKVILWGGSIASIQFLTGLSHLRRVLHSVHLAKVSDSPKDPDLAKLAGSLIESLTALLNKYAK